ncbi:PaaI family thioesterase [Adlercreutzia sp. ZJ304]|uniref:PaaI family thioesterase n=1 Tax=Adlercreutzia sp. ZJ304 TaxID=2709791 RepID=UPI0013EB9CF8|nr:PaaI family thioesterase [Adlercreutzia sp. ZJ304]
MFPEHPTLDELVDFFRNDRFASERCGCEIVEGWMGHGVCEMEITPEHLNAGGSVMGGAIFTLADYAFAVASMCGRDASVSLSSNIEFMKSSKGKRLIATCDVDKSGRKVGFYTTDVKDDLGEKIAKIVTTCYYPSVS